MKHINIKFKDLEFDLKQILVEKLPNNLTIGQGTSRVVNRVHCADGWRAYYQCAKDPEKCEHSLTITTNESGTESAIVKLKKDHTCTALACFSLVDAKSDMAEMTKAMAIDQSSARAPVIAMTVYKHFEEKYEGNFYYYYDTNTNFYFFKGLLY